VIVNRLPRRRFLAANSLWPLGGIAMAEQGETLPPIRRITSGPRFHWFGYYDKFQFDPSGRYVLGNEVDFEHRSPTPADVIRVGMIDLLDRDRWIELGTSRAWNWQQGCMLQFVPGSADEVIWNDREGDGTAARFVCHVVNIKTGRKRTLPHPFYTLSPDGRSAVFPDFRRLNDCRPGYGYAGIPDPNRDAAAPADAGIRRMSLADGKAELIVSLAEIADLPYLARSRPSLHDPKRSKHWFNHLLFNTTGDRFLWLHRWRDRGANPRGGFSTRMFTADLDGTNRYVVDPHGGTSHFIWRDSRHIAAWAWHPSLGKERFYLFRDGSDEVEPIGPEVMTVNGHNTYLPGSNGRWILNDTYPDSNRLQHPYLFDTVRGVKRPLGQFHSPKAYAGEWRCDLHPRANRDGSTVGIDSTHDGLGRQMYLIDVRGITTSA
jgi:hypothetical protein